MRLGVHLHRFFGAFQDGSAEPGDGPGVMATEGLDRPAALLQCLLDVMRVNFDPHAPGTLFLNSNIELISEGVALRERPVGRGRYGAGADRGARSAPGGRGRY